MRHLVSMRLAMFGLALAVPTAAWSDPPEDSAPPVRRPRFGHHRHLCPDCQLKERMKADGLTVPPATVVNAPPPPPPAPGMAMPAAVPGLPGGPCLACQSAGAPVMILDNGEMAGRAVVGGAPAGYATAGRLGPSAEPAPIGVVQAGYRPASVPNPMAAGPAGAYPGASAGGAAMPPSPTAVPPQPANRPHILSHLFGLRTGSINRARYDRMRADHARIRYDDNERAVGELPASMVYGGR